MANWRKLARRLALADGAIDEVEAAIIKKELLDDHVIDKEEMVFLIEVMRDAESVAPSFKKLFRKHAKAFILADGEISEREATWLRQVFDPQQATMDDYQFLRELNEEAKSSHADFVALVEEYSQRFDAGLASDYPAMAWKLRFLRLRQGIRWLCDIPHWGAGRNPGRICTIALVIGLVSFGIIYGVWRAALDKWTGVFFILTGDLLLASATLSLVLFRSDRWLRVERQRLEEEMPVARVAWEQEQANILLRMQEKREAQQKAREDQEAKIIAKLKAEREEVARRKAQRKQNRIQEQEELLVVGKGFLPTQADLQELSNAGHLARGSCVRALPGNYWRSSDEANEFINEVISAAHRKMGNNAKSDIEYVTHQGKEYILITSRIIEPKAGREEVSRTAQRRAAGSEESSAKAAFVATERKSDGRTYDVYRAHTKAAALVFLRTIEIKEEFRYAIVETPEGNFGRDYIMIFEEKTGKVVELGQRRPLPNPTKSSTHCYSCGYPVVPLRKFNADFGPGVGAIIPFVVVSEIKNYGAGFCCKACRAICCAFCATGANPQCNFCHAGMQLFEE